MSLKVTWDDYNTLVERLAWNVHKSGFSFNQIICIARGGLRVGDVLSRIYELPLAILSTHSYAEGGGTVRGQLIIAEHMTMTSPRLGDRILLVDDMVDSGHTLAAVHDELPKRFPHVTARKTAAVWWKACSVSSRISTSTTWPTIRGSTSRSRSTTICGRRRWPRG
jgi:hypoxanthine phosphoribosyltransferase